MSIDKNKKTHAPMRGNRGGHGVVMAGEKAKDSKEELEDAGGDR